MNREKLKYIIEAALMVSEKPLSISRLLSLFGQDSDEVDRAVIREALQELQQDYEGRGIELKEVSSGFRIQVNGDYADWVNRLFDERPPRYSRALLETLAIIAYRQPLTRAEIEDIRGVSVSSSIIRTLQERDWIRIVGHRDVPGKPELLATTSEFLDYFNLKKLSDLPTLAEIKELSQINPDLFDSLEEQSRNEEASGTDSGEEDSTGPEQAADEEAAEDREEEELKEDNVVPFTG